MNPPKLRTVTSVELLEKADSLVEYLMKPEYRENYGRWLFRGVKNADFELLPASRREGRYCPFRPVPSNEDEQWQAEVDAVCRFWEAAYLGGLQVPPFPGRGHSRTFFQNRWLGPDFRPLPGSKHFDPELSLEALAQHYGTPTRLLDWTTDSLVAAYFAVPDQPVEPNPDDKVAVWIFDTDAMLPMCGVDIYRVHSIDYHVNQNARAQRARALSYRSPGRNSKTIDRTTFVEYLESVHYMIPQDEEKCRGTLTKLVLPTSETPALRRLLDQHRINGATLFTGYDGAARAERERMWWEQPASE